MCLETTNDATAAWLDARTKPRDITLAIIERSGLGSQR
jgi:hypothetical protein